MAAVLEAALADRLAANRSMQMELEAMEARMMAFLKETELSLYPTLDDVSCKCIPEHRVPPAALGRHLKRCHGIADEHHASHEFFYEKMPHVENIRATKPASGEATQPRSREPMAFAPATASSTPHFLHMDNAYFDDDGVTDVSTTTEDDEVHSLVERSGSDVSDVPTAVLAIAANAVDFFTAAQAWTAIPRPFQRVDTSSFVADTKCWVHAYFSSHLSADEMDEDLTDYVLGLLDHPDFSQPDILVAELTEFLEEKTSAFVLALWKYLAVEVARRAVYNDARSQDELRRQSLVQVAIPPKQPSAPVPPGVVDCSSSRPQVIVVVTAPSNKRRRMSYRAKNTKRNYHEVVREMLEHQMADLGQRDGWHLAAAPASDIAPTTATPVDHAAETRRRALMALRDPLDVRNYDRDMARRGRSRSREPRQRESRSRDVRRSRSREPRRSRSREHRRRKRSRSVSPERSAKRRRRSEDRRYDTKSTYTR
ncbi:hypothetical protein SDRG_01620 [Saprolegnia diclina VS20]|uniref:PWI domain-containing protein n=1 Tax=Saprolegnia diclina (strain VS20) TaxID=1156394 RepID=T0SFD4_SAPDV|nr:hypothetical protein SDRG_01620 [Saprolegnia diclina VS20]EQC41662.1 hypothetical protein SDRG_01620 [Saprolegnia diclina VS20]|eukprot:XP_008605376.1 hypothetical protein SDRG_01620 [Saprolegnia diclina VS20]